MRGTTRQGFLAVGVVLISIHVPREGHDHHLHEQQHGRDISIHVPREGHDRRPQRRCGSKRISIHVPREGHDQDALSTLKGGEHFYPRAP